jgi:anti-sigma regulatory factor (Ser/Thr protein kinase)
LGWLELKASAELRAAGVLARLVDVALSGLGVAPSLCHDASLAVAELVANVHEHEYAGADGAVLVRLRLAADVLELEVESEGPAYDLERTLRESAAKDPLAALESGGQGLRLVAALFDEVEGQRVGETNRTRLRRRLS